MGLAKDHPLALLVCGVLTAGDGFADEIIGELENVWGETVLISPRIAFDFTEYYVKEMGAGIIRFYMAFDNLIEPEKIAQIKCQSNSIEQKYLIGNNRQVNIDPGYVTLAKLVLATTKDATHRIYIGNGIYAESTLYFRSGSFCPWQWTYPDYKSESTIRYFNSVREIYRKKIQINK